MNDGHPLKQPLPGAATVAVIRAADGEGSGIEADLVMAKRPSLAGQSFNGFPLSGAGIAAAPFIPAAFIARANFGA